MFSDLKTRLEEQMKIANNIKYYIGVDTYDSSIFAYCLVRKNIVDDSTEIILAKRMRERGFHEEVNNLSKYFNAEIIKEI